MSVHSFLSRLRSAETAIPYGRVRRLGEGLVESNGPAAVLGSLCDIECDGGARAVASEVVAVDESRILLVPFDRQASVALGARVVARRGGDGAPVGDAYSGRVVDALGRPLDGGAPVAFEAVVPLGGRVPRPLERAAPSRILNTGLRAIDGLLTLGEGQRIGLFAAAGVGKTSLAEQLARQVECDRCIVCMVGERGREVEAFWRSIESRADKARFTVVAATSDESAAMRARSVNYALCLAEHWRAKGEHVLLMIDSVTRLAMALREIGLAAGAPPTLRAYTPNVFAALPRIVERCGALASGGAISAIMTVLSETDDVDDPIVEVMKSLLDGHVILSRTLAEQAHFPAIDVPRSVSRGAERLVAPTHAKAMRQVCAMLGLYEESRVMIDSGVYKPGTNVPLDRAIAARPEAEAFLRQSASEAVVLADTVRALSTLATRGAAHA
ncbi:FliI/YscN family ATPase [Allosphingosinicella deserti]|uniref:FliI/YscN family ATPase n=1 Tax=Allosphingosinicella deserti TaxID=2116704 RepID=A0A2P7QW78_9SPHN|nr:FliI/YscN family ATPase [Sphingomonas deserti]PSJ42204.1 FliI/YscN family ATPase [Sphingomonas deserti]